MHFSLLCLSAFSGITAGFATSWFVLETLLGIKFLLAGSENEFITALFAN